MVCYSQVNTPTWGVEDTVLTISKTTDFGSVHDYLEIFNNSGQDVDMRWIPMFPDSWPSLWIVNFADPNQNYPDVSQVDSADFVMLDPIGFANKLIIGVSHQSYAHTDTMRFNVFPVNNREDSLILQYIIIIAQGNAWAGMASDEIDFNCFYNENESNIQLIGNAGDVKIEMFDLQGKLVKTIPNYHLNGQSSIDVADLKKQLYILKVSDGTKGVKSKKILLY